MTKAITLIGILSLASLFSGCEPARSSEEEKNIETVHIMHSEVWGKGNVSMIEELFAEDYVGHFPVGVVHGPDGVLARVTAHRTAFPDWTEEVDETIADGGKVVTRFTSRGTNLGAFLGRPATSKQVEISEVCIHRLVDGKIVEQWVFPDMRSMQMQLHGESKQ